MLSDSEKNAKSKITKSNVFNYMNIGREDPPTKPNPDKKSL
jgi:hypothetical protein